MNENAILISASVLGAVSTYVLSNKYKQSPVLASALLSFIVVITVQFFAHQIGDAFSKNIALLFFGGSFVGMSNSKVVPSVLKVGIGGFFFGVIFLLCKTLFVGFGGGLGFRATMSVLCVLGLFFVWEKVSVILRRLTNNPL